jgi:hypothetical protein
LIQSAMRCRSVACGTARSTRSRKSNNPVTFSVQRWAEIGTILCHQEANIRMTTKGNRYEYRSGFDQTQLPSVGAFAPIGFRTNAKGVPCRLR